MDDGSEELAGLVLFAYSRRNDLCAFPRSHARMCECVVLAVGRLDEARRRGEGSRDDLALAFSWRA